MLYLKRHKCVFQRSNRRRRADSALRSDKLYELIQACWSILSLSTCLADSHRHEPSSLYTTRLTEIESMSSQPVCVNNHALCSSFPAVSMVIDNRTSTKLPLLDFSTRTGSIRSRHIIHPQIPFGPLIDRIDTKPQQKWKNDDKWVEMSTLVSRYALSCR